MVAKYFVVFNINTVDMSRTSLNLLLNKKRNRRVKVFYIILKNVWSKYDF